MIVCQEYHILPCVSKISVQVCRHIFDIIDTSSQLTLLTKVIDTNEQSLASAGTCRVLKVVALGSTRAKTLGALRRWRWSVLISLYI